MKKKILTTAAIVAAVMPFIVAVIAATISITMREERVNQLVQEGRPFSSVQLFAMDIAHLIRNFWQPLLTLYVFFTITCFGAAAICWRFASDRKHTR